MNSFVQAIKRFLERETRVDSRRSIIVVIVVLSVSFFGCGLVHCASFGDIPSGSRPQSDIKSCLKPIFGAMHFSEDKQPALVSTRPAQASYVAALGRLEPLGEVRNLSVPGFLRDARVDHLYVREGDTVEAGQFICKLDTARRLESSLREAEQNIRVSVARLEQVKTAAKPASINSQVHRIKSLDSDRTERITAQKAAIARAFSQLEYASGEYDRFHNLFNVGAVSASSLDGKKAELRRAQENLNESKAELDRLDHSLGEGIAVARSDLQQLSTVRQVDIDVAKEELSYARANAAKIKTDLDMTFLRAPRDGRILKVLTKEGEQIGQSGVVEIGDTKNMVAVAEIYQTDIPLIKIGQEANITGDAFAGAVKGYVYQVGCKVEKQKAGSDSPDSPQDRRVVEVKLLLDRHGSKILQGLTDLEVEARIKVADASRR